MDRDRSRAATGITFGILWALSVAHLFNDTLQSVIAAIYPMLKHDLTLSFAQIGLITLIYQLAGSVFQPLAGLYFDKRPSAWALPAGMAVTMFGLLGLAYASSFAGVLAMTALTGIGSSVLSEAGIRSPETSGDTISCVWTTRSRAVPVRSRRATAAHPTSITAPFPKAGPN